MFDADCLAFQLASLEADSTIHLWVRVQSIYIIYSEVVCLVVKRCIVAYVWTGEISILCLLLQLQPFYGSLDIVRDNPCEPVPEKQSPTHTYRGHQSSLICFLLLLWSMASCMFNLRAWQSFCTISLQVFFGLLIGLAPPLYTPYISLPSHCLSFTVHAHTIATCFAVVLRLCHLILLSLSTIYLELYLVA